MIGLRARQRWGALDRVQAIHLLALVGEPPAAGEILLITDAAWPAVDEVRIERYHDVSLIEVVNGLRRRSGRHPLHAGRIVLMPASLRVVPEDCRHDLGEGWRSDRTCQEAKPRTATGLLRPKRPLHSGEEVSPGPHFPPVGDGLSPIRIVEVEDCGLGEDVRRTQTRGMFGVSFDFGWTPHMAFHQHRLRVTFVNDGTREKKRT